MLVPYWPIYLELRIDVFAPPQAVAINETSPMNKKKPNYSPTHFELVKRAESWLKKNGFKCVIRDPFKAATREQPDVIGWKYGTSVVIECKTNQADFRQDMKKPFRQKPELGMGQWRIFLAPKNLIDVAALPKKWGLLEATERQVHRTHGVPKGNIWSNPPFTDFNSDAERLVLTSALRRLEIRGYLPDIYEGIPHALETNTTWRPYSQFDGNNQNCYLIIEFTHIKGTLKKYIHQVGPGLLGQSPDWEPTRYCLVPAFDN